MEFPDGSKFEGKFSKNKVNGIGKFIHSDGDEYEGEWCNDNM